MVSPAARAAAMAVAARSPSNEAIDPLFVGVVIGWRCSTRESGQQQQQATQPDCRTSRAFMRSAADQILFDNLMLCQGKAAAACPFSAQQPAPPPPSTADLPRLRTRASRLASPRRSMSSSTPAPGGSPEPSLLLAALSLSGGGGGGDGKAPGAPLALPAVGARVRCEGLTGAAELNGCLGRVVSHEGARAKVRMDGPGSRVVGVKPQNLVVVAGLLDLLEKLPDFFAVEVLPRLDPADLCRCAAVGQALRAACAADAPTADRIHLCLLNAAQGVQPDNLAMTWVPWCHKAAELGHLQAQKCLARSYADGSPSVERNLAEAAKWCEKAADQGDANSQGVLGSLYWRGVGVERNDALAVKWFRLSAEQEEPVAQSNLGVCYDEGEGVPQNAALAVEWFSRAAAHGNAGAQRNLAHCYADGKGVERNPALAFEWWLRAANLGDVESQCIVATCLQKGDGVEQNPALAVDWYRRAAEQGHPISQCNLGNCHMMGVGVEQNIALGWEWLEKAGSQGNVDAQHNLAMLRMPV